MLRFSFMRMIMIGYVAVNGYLFARIFSILRGAGLVRGICCAIFVLLALSFPTSRFLYAYLPRPISNALVIIGSYYLAFMVAAFLVVAAADVLRLINFRITITPSPPPFTYEGRIRTALCLLVLTIAICAIGAINARFPRVVRHSLEYPSPAFDRLRIAMISDIHFGRMIGTSTLERILSLAADESPDIVIFAGDVIDDLEWIDDEEISSRASEIFRSLRPRLGVWSVLGNHEYYAGADGCISFLKSVGVNVLRDEAANVGELLLIGRDDRSRDRFEEDSTRRYIDEIISPSLRESCRRRGIPIITVDHQPVELEQAQEAGSFLQLSGHTHNGQLFPVQFIVSRLFERSYGLYKKGSTNYYISCGAGTWGPPIRTSGRPEVVIIDLVPEK